jgi:signal peptidase
MSSTATAGRRRTAARSAITPSPPAATLQVSPAPVGRRSRPRRLLGLLGNGLLLLCVLVFVLIAIGPHVFGYRTATMLTGSMEPVIAPGDVVVTVEKPAAEVAVGDVITYQIPVEDHRVETHRVVEVVDDPHGTIVIRTKGDANEGVDPWTATLQDDTVWEVRAVVPELGSAIRFLRAPAVQHGILWVAFGGLLLVGLSMIWRKDPDGEQHESDETDRE